MIPAPGHRQEDALLTVRGTQRARASLGPMPRYRSLRTREAAFLMYEPIGMTFSLAHCRWYTSTWTSVQLSSSTQCIQYHRSHHHHHHHHLLLLLLHYYHHRRHHHHRHHQYQGIHRHRGCNEYDNFNIVVIAIAMIMAITVVIYCHIAIIISSSFSFRFSSRWHRSARKGPYPLRPSSSSVVRSRGSSSDTSNNSSSPRTIKRITNHRCP